MTTQTIPTPDAPKIRELILEQPDFSAADVEELQIIIPGPHLTEVRQCLTELSAKRKVGSATDRDLLVMGVVSYLLGQHRQAEDVLGELPKNGMAAFYRGRALYNLGEFAEAAKAYDKAASSGYDKVTCALFKAGAVRQTGDLDEAEAVLKQTGREGVTRAEYSFQMGCLRDDRGDLFGAIEHFERAVDMDPHHTEALYRLANENNLLGNDEEAIKLYEQSLSRPPFFLGALINLGLLYEDNENYTAAAYCFRQVLHVDPNHERALLYLKDIEASSDMYYDEDAVRRQRELDQVMSVPITDFELSARSRNCLERAGIDSLGDLTRVTEEELLAGKNFGETSLKEIQEMLTTRGLSIGQFARPTKTTTPSYQPQDLSPQERAMLDAPVTDLNLSVRARKCLSRLGITALGELVSRTADELLGVRNFGVTSLNEIRAKLAEKGMKLRND